jgi:hypothetical protein
MRLHRDAMLGQERAVQRAMPSTVVGCDGDARKKLRQTQVIRPALSHGKSPKAPSRGRRDQNLSARLFGGVAVGVASTVPVAG